MFLDKTTGTRLHYIDVAWFAPRVVGLQRSGATSELTRLFQVIEMHHTDGDDYAKGLATIGYRGPDGSTSQQADVRQEAFEPYLGPESLRCVGRLNAFWSSRSPDSSA